MLIIGMDVTFVKGRQKDISVYMMIKSLKITKVQVKKISYQNIKIIRTSINAIGGLRSLTINS